MRARRWQHTGVALHLFGVFSAVTFLSLWFFVVAIVAEVLWWCICCFVIRKKMIEVDAIHVSHTKPAHEGVTLFSGFPDNASMTDHRCNACFSLFFMAWPGRSGMGILAAVVLQHRTADSDSKHRERALRACETAVEPFQRSPASWAQLRIAHVFLFFVCVFFTVTLPSREKEGGAEMQE